MAIDSPVALFVYKRPEFLPGLAERVRAAAPPRLYVFADAPRDAERDGPDCAAVLDLVRCTDWGCPVKVSVADRNLGAERVPTGIAEVFAREAQAIFVEDDVILSPSFFRFCDALLKRHADDPDVMMVSGLNPLDHWDAGGDYHFTTLGNAQAWGGWRRSWDTLDAVTTRWPAPDLREAVLQFLGDPEIAATRLRRYDRLGRSDRLSWDYAWALARQASGGLTAVPRVNLACHKGSGSGALNVKDRSILYELAGLHDLAGPFTPPRRRAPDRTYDKLYHDLTHDSLTQASARLIAERMATRGRRLAAVALLRHAARGAPLQPQSARMISALLGRLTAGSC